MIGIKDFFKVGTSRGDIMKPNREHSEISTIVQVYCGIPVLAEAYSDKTRVIDHAEELRLFDNSSCRHLVDELCL